MRYQLKRHLEACSSSASSRFNVRTLFSPNVGILLCRKKNVLRPPPCNRRERLSVIHSGPGIPLLGTFKIEPHCVLVHAVILRWRMCEAVSTLAISSLKNFEFPGEREGNA